MTKEPIPVVPAAHYQCGGVRTNLHGETDIQRLFALGSAGNGLHGANRLASNSLIEALVFSHSAVQRASTAYIGKPRPRIDIPKWTRERRRNRTRGRRLPQLGGDPPDDVELRGIVRSNKRLSRALDRIELLKREISEYYWNFKVTGDLLELRNICTVAELIVRCAMAAQGEAGLHTTIDYPYLDDEHGRKDTLVRRTRF